jgi:Autographiviridae endonuclease VII
MTNAPRQRSMTKKAREKRKRSAEWYTVNRERVLQELRERYANDPDYRAKLRKRANKARRGAELRRYYGMSLEDYDAKLAAQSGVCAMCGRKFKRSLCVDHCHKTGLLRGLLCRGCNVGIGNLGDDWRFLFTSAVYLVYWDGLHAAQLRKEARGGKRAFRVTKVRKKCRRRKSAR